MKDSCTCGGWGWLIAFILFVLIIAQSFDNMALESKIYAMDKIRYIR